MTKAVPAVPGTASELAKGLAGSAVAGDDRAVARSAHSRDRQRDREQ